MVAHPSLPAKTVPEFIAYAKANPGKIRMASTGVGSESHMSGELLKMMAGVSMVHVPYRGQAPALTDLLGGQVQVNFSTMPPAIGYVKAGNPRALAVTSTARFEALPDVPAMAEYLPGSEASLLTGLGVPSETPAEITRSSRTLARSLDRARALPACPCDASSHFRRLLCNAPYQTSAFLHV